MTAEIGIFKIQDGCYSQTYQTKPSQFFQTGILMLRWSFRHIKHQKLSTGDDFIHRKGKFESSIFGHQGGSGATCSNPIMWGILIRSFRHLEHKNQFIISDFIGYFWYCHESLIQYPSLTPQKWGFALVECGGVLGCVNKHNYRRQSCGLG